MFADIITVKNTFSPVLFNCRYIAIFSTQTDCKAPFEWTVTATELKVYEHSVLVQDFQATISGGDCPVAHSASLTDGSKLPDSIIYDPNLKTLTVKTDDLKDGSKVYYVKVSAHFNIGSLVYRSESFIQRISLEKYCAYTKIIA